MGTHALVVAAAPQAGGVSRVVELARAANLVVGVDGGADECVKHGVNPDVVVGDLDSLTRSTHETLLRAGTDFEVAPVHKDVTDLDLALAYLTREGVESVVVTGCTSGRLDHTLAAVGSLSRAAHLRPVLAENTVDGWVLARGAREEVEVGTPESTFSVIACGGPAVVSVVGARWPLDRAALEALGSLGVSNVVEGDRAIVRVHEGVVAVLVPSEV